MNVIRLYLLGSFRLERDSKPIHLATHKVESLLAYLALFPEQHSCEQLAAFLWGDATDEQARHSLRTALAAIREALDDALIADRESVQLNPDMNFWIDVKEIERLEIRDSSNLQSLISNYHELLPNFYDEWIVRERERLRAIYLDALLQLAQHYRSAGDYARAIETAQKILATERANEKAHQHLIFCYAVQGDRIAALKQYDECTKILREDLNAEPSSETTALRDQIMQELTGASSREASLTNLPTPLTNFVGREKELDELRELLGKARLLTVSGSGGCGKTRVAIQLGREAADVKRYKNGVWWVELAALSDSALVPQSVANVFDVRETADTPLVKLLTNFLREKELLLVLDNCEHLIDASARLAETLLNASPKLQILATSREALNVTGETVWHIPPLAVPNAEHLPPLNQLTQYDAIKLFVQCAAAIAPNWKLEGNARAVTQICARLDGVPLAIELAAARLKTLSAEQIAERLNDRFHLLTSGSRTALPRQQTLRAAIDWSFDLLTEPERVWLSRLSVFAGGWTFDAAECVCADSVPASKQRMKGDDILDLLSHLIDKSLVLAEEHDGVMRYRMLETIRQYGREKLLDSGENENVRNRHLNYFLKFAEEAEPKLRGPEQFEWLDRLEIEHDNLRAALDWSFGEGRVEKGLRLAAALMWFWNIRQYRREGGERVEKLLVHPDAAARTLVRANALLIAAHIGVWLDVTKMNNEYLEELVSIAREYGVAGKRVLALGLGFWGGSIFSDDPIAAESMLEEGLASARSLGDEWLIGLLLNLRGQLFLSRKDHRAARQVFDESLTRFKSLGDKHWAAMVSFLISHISVKEGEYTRARQEIEQALPFFRRAKNRLQVFSAVTWLGEIARVEDRYDLAKRYYAETLEVAREIGGKVVIAVASVNLGLVAVHDGELNSARSLFIESLVQGREVGYKPQVASALIGFASIAAAEKQARRAIQFFAVADTILEEGDKRLVTSVDEMEYERNLAIARAQLDDAAFHVAWAEGKAMTMEQAINYALVQPVESSQSIAPPQSHDPNALTPREVEVLRLAQAGLSDAKIAEKLVISRRTVNTHLSSIYGKLGVNSRSAATRYALDHKLI